MYDFDNPEDEVKKIDPPVPCNWIHVHTCNGLICFSSEDNNTIIIWNPATHKHRQVAAVKGCYPYCLGFGYDHKTDDYKVVMLEKLIIIKEEDKCFIVHVYSLKTGLWRRAADTTNEIVGPYLSVYASGAIHWMDCSLEKKNRLVAFDLTTEKWLLRTMPPESRNNRLPDSMKSWALSNHQESLCASYAGDKHNLVDLWVMKYEQGIKSNSWRTNCWDLNPKLMIVVPLMYLKPILAISERKVAVSAAEALMDILEKRVSVSGEPLQRLGAYMLEGLRARLLSSGCIIYKKLKCKEPTSSELIMSYMHVLYQICPYYKFAYMSANVVIGEAMENENRIHVIDFQIAQGSQWVSLIQALSRRPPYIRITGVDDSHQLMLEVEDFS
ncbi:hypothetical protein RD792_007794 [Penstemon davidsonii]|uniref:F-box associated beta-propeller type 3 domain-containing protein n=1 Tax=Penstemon davidsonii TaxID=160366 RepID=A0ABR0D8D8_9LAMI|nr:hypothetical protein RD792_007794 [Penstemon davidsonii]